MGGLKTDPVGRPRLVRLRNAGKWDCSEDTVWTQGEEWTPSVGPTTSTSPTQHLSQWRERVSAQASFSKWVEKNHQMERQEVTADSQNHKYF